MAAGPKRPKFYAILLVTGFLTGGFLNAFFQRVLPDSPTKDFFTFAVTPGFGPVRIDLLVVNFTIGPVGLEVSLLSLVGVVLAYLVAKSLF